MTPNIDIRSATPDDANLVLDSWTKSAKHSYAGVPGKLYMQRKRSEIAKILGYANCALAVDIHDPTNVYGWCCWHGTTLHYVYVKMVFRKLSIAKALMAHTGNPTHVSANDYRLVNHIKRAGWIFDPWLLGST